jgi:hypothetical protein
MVARKIRCMEFIQTLNAQAAALNEFDESLWNLMIASVTVQKAHLEVNFRTGQSVKVAL